MTDEVVDKMRLSAGTPSTAGGEQFTVYRRRWHMLMIYSVSSLLNAVLWISFSAVVDATAQFFDCTIAEVDWLALVFQVLYAPGTVVALYLLTAISLRQTLLVGGAAGAISAGMRAIAVPMAWSSPRSGYWMCLFGQILGGLAQPIFLAVPAKVAGNWFPVEERDLATTICALFNPLGNAFGQAIPPFVVQYDDDSNSVAGMSQLLVGQAVVLTASFLWTFFCFESHPPTPPSKSAAVRRLHERDHHDRDSVQSPLAGDGVDMVVGHDTAEPEPSVLQVLEQHMMSLLRNPDFMILLLSFSFALALFNGLLTVIAKWLEPYGFSDDQAGILGGVLIVSGLVGAAVAAVLMDLYHCYKLVLKGMFVCVCVTSSACCVLLQHSSFGVMIGAFAVFGLVTLPLLPAVIENAVECTYPVPEEASSAILFCSGNIVGIGVTIGMAKLVKLSTANAPFTPINLLVVGLVVMCTCIVMLYRGQYKRLEADKAVAAAASINEPLIAEDGRTSA